MAQAADNMSPASTTSSSTTTTAEAVSVVENIATGSPPLRSPAAVTATSMRQISSSVSTSIVTPNSSMSNVDEEDEDAPELDEDGEQKEQ